MGTLIVLVVLIIIAAAGFMMYKASREEAGEVRSLKALPPSVQSVVVQMDEQTQAAFFNEYEKKKKKKTVGYFAWAFFGWHYFYVGKPGMNIAYWLFGWLWWWFIDFFRLPGIIRYANEQVARQAIQTLHMGAAFGAQKLNVAVALSPQVMGQD